MPTLDCEAALTPSPPEQCARAAGGKALQRPRRQLRGPARAQLRGASRGNTGKVRERTPPPHGSAPRGAEQRQSKAVQEDTAGARGETRVRRARDQHQLRPPPPSCPSPPAEPDFTPPAVRAGRNSHFAAADPAPTTAAACVTSRRRAAGPAPPQRPGSRARSEGGQPPSACSASCSSVIVPPATHRPPPPALSPVCPPPKARAHEAPPCGGIPLIAKLGLERAEGVGRAQPTREPRFRPCDLRNPQHAAQSQRSALTAGSPPCFPP